MSSNSIGAVSNTAAASSTTASTASTTATALTSATKAKLEALGIDTTNIKTEADGQSALIAAQQTQKKAHANKSGNSSEQEIKTESKELASQVGVPVAEDDTTDTIISNVSEKISELQASAGDDEAKLAEVNQYQTQLETISSEYSQMQASHAQLSNSLEGLARYNKTSM